MNSRFSAARDVLMVALWTALVAGTVHVLVVGVRRLVLNDFIWFSREVVWMAPLGYLLTFAPFAILGAVVAWLVPHRWIRRLAIVGFAALVTFAFLLPITQIARVAALALALGVGVQAARVLDRWGDRMAWRLARQSVVLATLVVVATLAVTAGRAVSVRRAQTPASASASGDAPNVLFIILDTVRAASLSAFGYARETTPEMKKRAAEGVLFERAYSTAPWTLASHATMFTGRYPGETSVDWLEPLDDEPVTLAELFRARGYATAAVVANHHYASYESGLGRGFSHYDDYVVSLRQTLRSTWFGRTDMFKRALRVPTWGERLRALRSLNFWTNTNSTGDPRDAAEITTAFLDWHAQAPKRPFFGFLNYMDAHEPVEPPPPYDTMFGRPPNRVDLYDGALRYQDVHVARLLDELARRGALDNTIVVYTADHGELLGEHNLVGHSHNMYDPVLRVPLFIRAPGRVPAGVRIATPVTLRDIAATVLELTGARAADSIPGTPLSAHWRPDSARSSSVALAEVTKGINLEPWMPIAKGPMKSLVRDRWHYIRNGDGKEEVFDLSIDPAEANNVVGAPQYRDTVSSLRGHVDSLLARRGARAGSNR
jgi:arylsulfatase A-like enzyme